MTDIDIWNDPDLLVNDDYVTFENVGDTVTGTIISIRKHIFDDGKAVPQIILDVDGAEKTVTAGQVRLKAELATLRPQPGQVLSITLTEVEKRSGGKTLKHFDVKVGAIKPTVVPAPAGDGYTPEQLEAFKLLGIDPPAK
jgi:hypothetical protein